MRHRPRTPINEKISSFIYDRENKQLIQIVMNMSAINKFRIT